MDLWKRILNNKYLVVGLILSIFLHLFAFGGLYLLTKKERKKQQKEKPITISLVKPTTKINKSKGTTQKKHKVSRVHKKRKVKKKRVIKKKTVKKVIKKKPKKVVKPKPKKIVKKPKPKKVIKEKVVKKAKKVIPKPVKKPEKVIKKVEPVKKVQPEKHEIKPSPTPEPVKSVVQKEKPKQLTIPDLSEVTKHKKQQDKKKDEKVNDYLKYIKEEFEKNKFYPYRAKKLGIEGTVIIKFVVLPDGTIQKDSIQIVEADHPILARGAKRIFEKIKKLPPTPNKEKMTIEIPIEYILYDLY